MNVCVYVFDILFWDNESLLPSPLHKRRQVLFESIKVIPMKVQYVDFKDITDEQMISQYLKESVN